MHGEVVLWDAIDWCFSKETILHSLIAAENVLNWSKTELWTAEGYETVVYMDVYDSELLKPAMSDFGSQSHRIPIASDRRMWICRYLQRRLNIFLNPYVWIGFYIYF